ncbi:hypothetical protein FH972_023393 [Carpinus fangiana]|uniref:FAD-binding domain-containing protein n=1 Tax=Carpinus fangiana TaxID=176857 RepID=A0A5N6KV29_9ROSI|nr:hypothetical protein FH972_023393 [Carpinus fangiana]
MAQARRVVIVGAGVGGSALAALLRSRGLAATLLDKNSKPPAHSYSITLERSVITPLLAELQTDESSFVRKVTQPLLFPRASSQQSTPASLPVSRASFESYLREDLDVQWNSAVQSIDLSASPISIKLEDGRCISADILIAADGVHSVVRKSLLPDELLEVMPYAVINGRANLSFREGQDIAMRETECHHEPSVNSTLIGSTRLAYSIYKYDQDRATVDFTFSRPARVDDELYKPNRPNSGARDIPDELFAEAGRLQPLSGAFADIFDPSAMRQARLLHWLMRKSLLQRSDLDRLATRGTFFIGDAAHAMPILGGNGANQAIKDALQLSSLLHDDSAPVAGKYYDARYLDWSAAVSACDQALAAMHSSSTSVL